MNNMGMLQRKGFRKHGTTKIYCYFEQSSGQRGGYWIKLLRNGKITQSYPAPAWVYKPIGWSDFKGERQVVHHGEDDPTGRGWTIPRRWTAEDELEFIKFTNIYSFFKPASQDPTIQFGCLNTPLTSSASLRRTPILSLKNGRLQQHSHHQ